MTVNITKSIFPLHSKEIYVSILQKHVGSYLFFELEWDMTFVHFHDGFLDVLNELCH